LLFEVCGLRFEEKPQTSNLQPQTTIMGNPLLGLVFHWLGGLAAGSFYLPYKAVRRWSWETYWLIGGFFSWIIAPWVAAALLCPGFVGVLRHSPGGAIGWALFWGLRWGIGGLTFGLSIRYLGMSLGYAVALGFCAAFGTVMPPIFAGTYLQTLHTPAGKGTLIGIVVCVIGIAVAGLAGRYKERELTPEQARAGSLDEFNFVKGILVATFAGILSASMAYGLAAADPIARLAASSGTPEIWTGLPKLVVVLLGGFATNFIWCVALNLKNRSWGEYAGGSTAAHADELRMENPIDAPSEVVAESMRDGGTATAVQAPSPTLPRSTGRGGRMTLNYLLCAAAGITWYLQFFFYTMGESQMGKYKFSSWTLHMASIIIFSTLWGLALHEWRGTSRRTKWLLTIGLALLVISTLIVGYGNYLGAQTAS
jgi:L-rhamnose-H+ transport protein